jgi:hypothetical protein
MYGENDNKDEDGYALTHITQTVYGSQQDYCNLAGGREKRTPNSGFVYPRTL